MEIELEEAKAEIERLKCILADKETIIINLGDTKSPKSSLSEGDLVVDLENRHRKVEEELKWKVEKFKHLEEAHEKLRNQFHECKSEWEKEKSALVDEITQLQERFDDKNQKTDELKLELAMCRQGLENEEKRRKKLEEHVSDLKSALESATNEGIEGKREEECSAAGKREEEVANLRHSLRVKEMDYKDLTYKAKKLEKENQELLTSIKELQEAHIPRAVPTPSSWAKLKSRLKSIEQSHRECTANIKSKETEWNSKTDRLTQELNRTTSNLKMRDQFIEDLKTELERCNSSLTQLKMQNEELSLMLQLMKSEGSENIKSGVAHLMDQLEKEREEKHAMQEELDQLRDELESAQESLDRFNSELTDRANDKSELELELENWISVAAHLERQVTGTQLMRRELELSLLAQAEVEEMLKLDTVEKEKRISNLEHQIFLMDQEIRIEEHDDEEMEEDENITRRLKIYDGEQLQLELLAKELEEAIVSHILGERNYIFEQDNEPEQKQERMVLVDDPKGDEVCASKENVTHQHSHLRKTSDPFVEKRSPFKELN
ncbi:uncharacterized protein At4g38062-like [Amaranthus tricolor]|uniref:uncharacterized protein At4g38062-like n=1 Tax=Amaranthus tricolor TaxID=29722 RepID=UPI00258BFD1E|nr:uncharacterized protein At4g38062-like [Amaranthus tricolor]